MHGGRAAQKLLRRALIPAHHAERTSLFYVSGAVVHFDSRLRCLESALVRRSCDRQKFIWDWRRHDCPCNKCVSAERLHVRLSLATTFDRRFSGSTCKVADLLPRLRLCHLLESPPHALGLDESLLGRLYRSVCATLRDGNLA